MKRGCVLETERWVAEIPETARRQIAALEQPIRLPVKYDNLTWIQRRHVREDYILRQKGDCWHCGHSLAGPPPREITDLPLDGRFFGPAFLKHPIHLHHDHQTGYTIGATHAYCNGVLAQYYGE